MSKFYTFLLSVLVATLGLSASAQKTVHFTVDNPAAASVSFFNMTDYSSKSISWDGNSGTLEIPDNTDFRITANDGFEIAGIEKGGSQLISAPTTYYSVSAGDFADGDTYALTTKALAPKTVTVTANDPTALSVYYYNASTYSNVYATWQDGKAVVEVPVNASLTVSANSGYKITAMTQNGSSILSYPTTSTSLYYSSLTDGATIDVTLTKEQPKLLIIKGDPSTINVQSSSSTITPTDGQWTIEVTSSNMYGSTSVYANDGYMITSIKKGGQEMLYTTPSTYYSIYHSGITDGDNIYIVEAIDKSASRTSSFSVEIDGDASKVSIQLAGDSNPLSSDKYAKVAFSPEMDLPVTIKHIDSEKMLPGVTVNGTAVSPEGTTYRLSSIPDGATVKVTTDFEDKDVAVKFDFVNADTREAVKLMRVNNELVDASVWSADNFTVKLGSKIYIEINSTDYNVNSITLNGQSKSAWISEYILTDTPHIFTIDVTKKRPYILTINCNDPTKLIVKKGSYSSETYPLTGETTVIEVPQSNPAIKLSAVDGYYIESIYKGADEFSSDFYMQGDMELDVTTAEFKRDNTLTVFFEDTDWRYRAITLSSNNYDFRKEIEITANGYSFINFADADNPLAASATLMNSADPTAYLNGEKLTYRYGTFYGMENIADGDVLKFFAAEPESYTVTYTIDPGVAVEVRHDHTSVIDNPSTHSVFAGTECHIVSLDAEKINAVKINDEPIDAIDGKYVFTVTADTDVKVTGNSGIENVSVDNAAATGIYNLQGIRLDAESAEELPAGVYIINGKTTAIRK